MLKGLALLVVLIASGWFAFQYLTESAPNTTPVPTPRPPDRQATAPAQVAQTVPTPGSGEVMVEVDEATLTRQLNEAIGGRPVADTPLGPATLRNPAVRLRDGQIKVAGNGEAGGMSLPVDVTGTVRMEADQPRVRVSEARVGGIPLPEESTRQIEAAIQAQLDQQITQQQVRVRTVTVSDGRIAIVGSRAQ